MFAVNIAKYERQVVSLGSGWRGGGAHADGRLVTMVGWTGWGGIQKRRRGRVSRYGGSVAFHGRPTVRNSKIRSHITLCGQETMSDADTGKDDRGSAGVRKRTGKEVNTGNETKGGVGKEN